ncbi:hypothetical protein Val02_17720 [Virgisporangium aliadipatigenens]|uniref:Uncharacterized protein n=1 Tax=Virgisporangium aliadipatigenens TaxID=741659 RepID=A0A8J3YJ56_9ACTN|nr:hypothetical protein Val02_17720 [Virgisporangium aliadipatigenens]
MAATVQGSCDDAAVTTNAASFIDPPVKSGGKRRCRADALVTGEQFEGTRPALAERVIASLRTVTPGTGAVPKSDPIRAPPTRREFMLPARHQNERGKAP